MIRFASDRGMENCDLAFAREVQEKSQSHLERCYQCLTCSSTCPVAFAMDYTPNQIARLVQLGLKEPVLSSSTIWLCASCESCAARCPHDVDIVRMMDTLRQMALKEKYAKGSIPAFHTTFLECIRSRGRVDVLPLTTRYLLTSGDIFRPRKLFGYLIFGLKMLLKGKLPLLPGKTSGREAIKRIFQLTGQP